MSSQTSSWLNGTENLPPFDNLKRYWEKKKKEIMISKKMQKKIDKEWFAWYDFVLGIYLADWMKTKIPDFER